VPPSDAAPVFLPAPQERDAQVPHLGLPEELLDEAGLRPGVGRREPEVHRCGVGEDRLLQERGEARQNRGKLSVRSWLVTCTELFVQSVPGMGYMHSVICFFPL
jgi:hypothetical protein